MSSVLAVIEGVLGLDETVHIYLNDKMSFDPKVNGGVVEFCEIIVIPASGALPNRTALHQFQNSVAVKIGIEPTKEAIPEVVECDTRAGYLLYEEVIDPVRGSIAARYGIEHGPEGALCRNGHALPKKRRIRVHVFPSEGAARRYWEEGYDIFQFVRRTRRARFAQRASVAVHWLRSFLPMWAR